MSDENPSWHDQFQVKRGYMTNAWIRFLWKLFPSDYRRDIKINILRSYVSWLDNTGKSKDKATIDQIQIILTDLYD